MYMVLATHFGVQKQHKHMWHFQIHLIHSNKNKGHLDNANGGRFKGRGQDGWGRRAVVG